MNLHDLRNCRRLCCVEVGPLQICHDTYSLPRYVSLSTSCFDNKQITHILWGGGGGCPSDSEMAYVLFSPKHDSTMSLLVGR